MFEKDAELKATDLDTAKIGSEETFLDDHQVAKKLNIKVERLRVKICRGEPLPPYLHPPGFRNRFWIEKDVEEWLKKYKVYSNAA